MRDAEVVAHAPAVLEPFNAAGMLGPADVHAAVTLCRVLGEAREEVLLAAALAFAAPRVGHVCLDLSAAPALAVEGAEDEEAAGALPWPGDVAAWRAAVAASPLLVGEPAPLALVGDLLYLERYRRYERQVVARLCGRATARADGVDVARLRADLDAAFGPPSTGAAPDGQRLAAATAVLRRLAVLTGGPGTGKTTTVRTVVALLDEQAVNGRRPRVALAAFSGKAAARLGEVVGRPAVTLHRLLRPLPGSRTRFRHDADHPLPHDVVIVDEASMIGVALMAKLLTAVRDDARLVLVGDAEQLRSIEAGAVLRDVVAGAAGRSPGCAALLAEATGEEVAGEPGVAEGLGDGVVVLERPRRFGAGSGIAAVAAAVRAGDEGAVVTALRARRGDVEWVAEPEAVRGAVVAAVVRVAEAARVGDAEAALAALDGLRVLCVHRRGPDGVAAWGARVERWLGEAGVDVGPRWYVGRPVMVTVNDYGLRLFNGDLGVVVRREDGGVEVAFATPDGPRRVAPARLEALETVHAMTVHKGQGSQVDHAVVVLPEPPSPLLTRELLYTALTRARRRVTLVAPEAAVRAAVARPLHRVSGLRAALAPP